MVQAASTLGKTFDHIASGQAGKHMVMGFSSGLGA
jgi:hypothetical protein